MKRFQLRALYCVGVFAATLCFGGLSDTADADSAPYGFSWTGFYGGVHLGYSAADIDHFDVFGAGTVLDHNVDGAIYGGQIGYNHQLDDLVLGIEAEVSGSDVDGNAGAGGTARGFDLDVTYGVRGRLGYAMDQLLFYATAGVTIAEVDATSAFGADGDTHVGFVVGGGAAWRLTELISLGVEYLYADYETKSYAMGGAPDDISFDTHTVRAVLNFHIPGM